MKGRWHDESGATLVVVAVSLLALFGVTMLAVDGGSLLTTRRSLVTDTDASAVASARYLNGTDLTDCLTAADESTKALSGAYGEALTVLQANDSRITEPFEFEVDLLAAGSCEAGKVRVADTIKSPVFFSGIFGFDGFDVYSSSSAIFGFFNEMEGLRPFGICSKSAHFTEWTLAKEPREEQFPASTSPTEPADELTAHPTHLYPGAEYWVHRIEFRDPSGAGLCNDAGVSDAGNWGWLDYDGAGTPLVDEDCVGGGASALACNIDYGYPGSVALQNCDQTDDTQPDCPAEPGGKDKVQKNLADLTCDANIQTSECPDPFWILVYDQVTEGPGKTLLYNPVAFLGVVLRDASPGVTKGNPNADAYFDFEFIGYDETGPITGRLGADPTGLGLLPKGAQLCGGNYGGTIDENCGLIGP